MLNVTTPRVRRLLTALTLALIFISFIPARRTHAAAGDLDPSFGVGGKVVTVVSTGFTDGFAEVRGIISQADGRLVVVGDVIDVSAPTQDFVVLRYDVNGNPDPTFGVGGRVTTDFLGYADHAYGVAQQPDGKIVVAGDATDSSFSLLGYGFALARYNSNGSLDTSFGTGGKVRIDLADSQDELFKVAIQSDGKIVAAGHAYNSAANTDNVVVARYNSDGSLDTGFGTGGLVFTSFNSAVSQALGLGIQADGRIVIAGFGGNQGMILARYMGNGSLDASFGTGGKVDTTLGLFGSGLALALQPDGKIVVSGNAFTGANTTDFGVARFLNDGSRDLNFGIGGQTFTNFGPGSDNAYQVMVQPDGKIVAAGFTYDPITGGDGDFAVARYHADGSPDLSFGAGGKMTTDFSGGVDFAFGAAIQPNGRIVVAGQTLTYDGVFSHINVALAAYTAKDIVYDLCLQDDSNGNLLQFNSTTGDYLFTNCGGVTMGGTGAITRRGNVITLQHNTSDRRVLATIDVGTHRATASVQSFTFGKTFSLTDRNTANNTCACK